MNSDMTAPTYRTAIGITAIALIVLASLWFLPVSRPTSPAQAIPSGARNDMLLSDAIRAGSIPRPPLTASSTIKALTKTRGFQALVSYTDAGFEPKEVTIKAGQTVRFTNNSSHPLRVASKDASVSDALYCQRGSFDSCTPIRPQEFWEFTFETSGAWQVTNALDPTSAATVQVR